MIADASRGEPEMEPDDGVKRKGKDYRTGYVEGLMELADKLGTLRDRATKKQAQGLEEAYNLAQQMGGTMRNQMAEAKAPPK